MENPFGIRSNLHETDRVNHSNKRISFNKRKVKIYPLLWISLKFLLLCKFTHDVVHTVGFVFFQLLKMFHIPVSEASRADIDGCVLYNELIILIMMMLLLQSIL